VKLMGDHLGPFAWVGGGLIIAAAATLTTRGHALHEDLADADTHLM